jgi:uncharacterized phage-associated protein
MPESKSKTARAPGVKLEPNIEKIVSAICFVIAEAGERCLEVSQYDIIKTLFLADKKHLNEYGRPVTFDNYCAMKYGPVPSFAYDLLKGNASAIRKYGKKIPWSAKKVSPTINNFSIEKGGCSFNLLSPSDRNALSGALTTIKSLTFGQIKQLTHADPAYTQAWSDEGGRESYPMDLALLFDTPNYEAAKTVAFLSKHM